MKAKPAHAETASHAFSMAGKWGETAVLVVITGIAIFALANAIRYPAGSSEYPSGIATLILVFALWRSIELLRSPSTIVAKASEVENVDEADDSPKEELPLRQTAIYAGLIVALVVALYFVWFPIAAFVSGIAVLKFVFDYGWIKAVIASALVSGISSAIFTLLGVPLPGGAF